jgi:hypothetical protein
MFGGVFDYVDPMRGVQTSIEGKPLLDILLLEHGWTRDNIGPVYQRFVLDEMRGPKNPKPVIRPNQIIRDGFTETVSLTKLLKPRACLPTRAIMFTSGETGWEGEQHVGEALSEWKTIFAESRETYPRNSGGRVELDCWYAITRIDFPDLHLADQLDIPAREYRIPLRVLWNPDNIEIATGEFESCYDRARRISDWIFHKPFVW